MHKKLLALLLVLTMLFSIALTGCNKTVTTDKDDAEKAETVTERLNLSLVKTADAILESSGATEVVKAVAERGCVHISLANVLTNTLYLDSTNNSYADRLVMVDGGNEFEFNLIGNPDEVAVSGTMFGNKTYGVNLNTLLTDMKDSAIWSMLGSDYDTMMSENKNAIQDMINLMQGSAFNFEETTQDAADKITDVLEGVNPKEETCEIEVGGEKVSAIKITYTLTETELLEIVDVYIGIMEDMTGELMDSMTSVNIQGTTTKEDAATMFEEMRNEFVAEFEGVSFTADLSYYLNTKTDYLMKITADGTVTYEGETAAVSMYCDLGKDPTESNCYDMKFTATSKDGNVISAQVTASRETNGDTSAYKLSVVLGNGSDENKMTVTVEHNSKTNAYSASVEISGAEILSCTGICELTDKRLALTVDTITSGPETAELGLEIVLEAITAEQMPTVGAYENIFTLDETGLMELVMAIEGGVSHLPEFETPNVSILPVAPDI